MMVIVGNKGVYSLCTPGDGSQLSHRLLCVVHSMLLIMQNV